MDIELHYEGRGAGDALVLLHGNGESADYFSRQLNYFAADYRVIAVDTRGHGGSPRGAAPFTLSQFADDLKAFLDGLGLGRVNLLGFSDGGNIALIFALRYPRYVDKLILDGANLNPRGVKRRYQIPTVIAWAAMSASAVFSRKAIRKKELLELMVREPHISPDSLCKLRMPVLVIAGDRDMIKTAHTQAIAGGIQGAVLRIIPGDHFIAAKESAAFNKEVAVFLKI
ncbi:MAG: alpha/beta hydrolase [Clostridia bacterium]|nr:alpha/beta hydrolase [Clostridia bacterium]